MKARKILVSLAALALVAAISIGGTIAYLTSTKTVTNTFTVGDVKITMDEALVNADGKPVKEDGTVVTNLADAKRVYENSYKLLPGHVYTKDPTVKVEPKSEAAYLRILVKVDSMDKLQAAFPAKDNSDYYANGVFLLQKLVDWDPATTDWNYYGYDAATSTYEFRYKTTVANDTDTATPLQPLFTKVIVPGDIDNDHLAKLNEVKIEIVAQAIQADGFVATTDKTAADVAWAAFK